MRRAAFFRLRVQTACQSPILLDDLRQPLRSYGSVKRSYLPVINGGESPVSELKVGEPRNSVVGQSNPIFAQPQLFPPLAPEVLFEKRYRPLPCQFGCFGVVCRM